MGLEQPMALNVGSRLGHYDVTALIGEGGMGQVYQATDTKLNRQVALKILPEAFAEPDAVVPHVRICGGGAHQWASLLRPARIAVVGARTADDHACSLVYGHSICQFAEYSVLSQAIRSVPEGASPFTAGSSGSSVITRLCTGSASAR